MNLSTPSRCLSWLAAALLLVGSTGCATAGAGQVGAGAPTGAWPMDEAAETAARLEQRRLMAVLQRLSAAGSAYDRMTEARSTIIDTVSWWGALASPAAPPSPPDAAALEPEAAAPTDDPYAELDAELPTPRAAEPKRP